MKVRPVPLGDPLPAHEAQAEAANGAINASRPGRGYLSTVAGLYVETRIHAPLEVVWQHTQDPALHSRWDLRFSTIEYLPRTSDDEPQRFLYATRIAQRDGANFLTFPPARQRWLAEGR